MLELTGLTKTYKKAGANPVCALDGVSLHIEQGEFIAILGPSGSGKSTLMNILGLMDRPDSGEYLLDGTNVLTMRDDDLARLRSRTIGFVFQAYHLLPRTTAIENVKLALLYGDGDDYQGRSERALEAVGLAARKDHYASELSGGQQQRVAIARAIVKLPKIILADEPTGNLDSITQAEIMELFKEQHRNGTTVILITHNSEVARAADRIISVRDGRVESDKSLLAPRSAAAVVAVSAQGITP